MGLILLAPSINASYPGIGSHQASASQHRSAARDAAMAQSNDEIAARRMSPASSTLNARQLIRADPAFEASAG